MRLPLKLSLLLACAATGPLALATASVVPEGTRALRGQLDQLYAQDARALASEIHRSVLDQLETLSLAARTLRLAELDAKTREQALLLLYRETKDADVVGLFDQRGQAVVPPVHFATLQGQLAGEHETVDDIGAVIYSRHVPLQAALDTGLAIGPVYVIATKKGEQVPRVVLAAAVPGKQKWVLAMELSLRSQARALDGFHAGPTGTAFLVDSRNKVIVHPDRDLMMRREDLSGHPLLSGKPSGEWLGASATVPLLGWKVVVQEATDEGLATLRRLVLHALGWVALGLLAAVATGLVAVRAVTLPLGRLRAASLAVTGGALETSVEVEGKDELAELASAFNSMTRGLREREEMKLTLSLSSTLDLQEVLSRLLDSLGRVVHFDRAAVLLLRDQFELAYTRGYDDPAEAQRLLPRPGASAPVDVALRSLGAALSDQRTLLALPLLSRGAEPVGVVCLTSRVPYEEETVRVAFNFIQPATLAVDNARLFAEVKRLATIDGLTGVSNRRHFVQLAEKLFETASRYGQPLCAIMLDVDHFKLVNDAHGHAVGDQVLRAIADRIKSCLRSADLLGRYGGEEFCMLLPVTTKAAATGMLAERIRRSIAQTPIPTDGGPVSVTVSLGVASNSDYTPNLADLLKRADASLYEAKQAGRNRVA